MKCKGISISCEDLMLGNRELEDILDDHIGMKNIKLYNNDENTDLLTQIQNSKLIYKQSSSETRLYDINTLFSDDGVIIILQPVYIWN